MKLHSIPVPAVLAAVLAIAGLTGCNLLEAMRQTSPHRSDKPVIFSDPWKADRQARKAEAQRIKERHHLEAWAAYLASLPDPTTAGHPAGAD